MEILRTIQASGENRGLRFVVIGGQAINCYGLSRQTGDINLLVDRSQSHEWSSLLQKLDYTATQNDQRFARYRSVHRAAWPIGLMFVESKTFQAMFDEASELEIGVSKVKVASPRHLIALKVHALKTFEEYRHLKDYGDLLGLLRRKESDVSTAHLREIYEKYASQELFVKLSKDLDLRE
jgi:predicted nucleotidyltransferase